jgi:two-component system cell cycle sensor histidine kinase/response regulator CckA
MASQPPLRNRVHAALRRPETGMLGLAALLLLLIAGVSYTHWTHYRRANRHAAQAEALLEAVEQLLTTLLDAETGQRGFLLTGDERYLEPYTRALHSADRQVLQLTSALASFQGAGDEGTPLPRLMELKLAEVRETIALYRTHGLSAALEVVRTGQGKRTMDEVRRRCAHLRHTLAAVLRAERAQGEAYAQRTHVVATGGALLLFGFLLAASLTIHRAMRHRAHALSESHAIRDLLETTLASIGDAVLTTDATGRLTFANATAQALLRWPAAEMTGQPLEEVFRIINEYSRAPVENPVGKVLREGTIVGLANHTVLLARDGTEIPIDDSAAPIRDTAGAIQGTVLVFRDITERRRAEAMGRLLASIVESSEDAIISKDLHGVITSWNEGAERLLGYTAAEAIGQPITLIADPERLEEMAQILERITRGERVEHYDTLRRTKGGQIVHVSLTVSPIHDASGRIVGASKIARDITALRRLEEQLRHAQKMEALGTMAGGIAHDFNNILAAILGYTELLQREMPVGSPVGAWLQEVLTASLRAKALVQQILAFSRRTPVARTPVSLAAVLRETLPFLRALLPSTIALEDHCTPEATRVLADATQLQQILMNLGTNARDAMGDTGGRLAMSLEVVEVDAAYAATHPALHAGPYVRLTVRDSGPGIPPAVLARIFEPFFTTKEVGHGTGLGLAVVHGIVESHGGAILVESTLGQGTTFTLYLPRLEERAEGDAHPAVEDRPRMDT